MKVIIAEKDISIVAIRASGPGGQHVNKVATAVQLRFDIDDSSLSPEIKEKLKNHSDHRISKDGTILIQSSTSRSQLRNRKEALHRLQEILDAALAPVKKRRATKPSKSSRQKRLDNKKKRGELKKMRERL